MAGSRSKALPSASRHPRRSAIRDVAPRGSIVRVGPVASLPSLMRELGRDPAPLLAAANVDEAYFDDPDLPISYVAAGRLIADAAAATGCEHFGLLMGARAGPSTLGLPGFLLQTAPDVGTALRDLVRFLHLHDRGGVAMLDVDARNCALGFAVVEPGVEVPGLILDVAIAIGCNVMRGLCGAGWNPDEVLLSRSRPADAAPWRRFYRAPVRFDAAHSALVFGAHWLARRIPTSNPALHLHLEKEALTRERSLHTDLEEQTRRIVRGMLAGGGCTAARTARLLGVHERTLNRRLRVGGTTFRRVIDEVRYEVARQLLAHTSMPLNDVAATLGYAEASPFVRAFARWSGLTPMAWRRDEQGARRR